MNEKHLPLSKAGEYGFRVTLCVTEVPLRMFPHKLVILILAILLMHEGTNFNYIAKAGTGDAGPHFICRQYVKTAVDQSEKFDGYYKQYCREGDSSMWNKNFDAHYNWCMHVGKNDKTSHLILEGSQKRSMALKRCQNRIGGCSDHASRAIEQVLLGLECGATGVTSGAAWNPSNDVHFKWCMGVILSKPEVVQLGHDERHRYLVMNCPPRMIKNSAPQFNVREHLK